MLSSTDQYFSQCFEKPSRWALHVVNDLPLFTWDRVALIGDAVSFLCCYNNPLTRSYT